MKTYCYKIHDHPSGGMVHEVRSPVIEDLGGPPNNEVFRVRVPNMNTLNLIEEGINPIDTSFARMQEQMFETICFRTMIWVEEYARGHLSCGHYRIYNSYASIPYGATVPRQTEERDESESESERYAERIRELEVRFREEEMRLRLAEARQEESNTKNEESNTDHFSDIDFSVE